MIGGMISLKFGEEKMSHDLLSVEDPFETGACFPRGTLVHTDKGLVPIEQIKVGDLVLSQPEMTGELEYKPVVKTVQREDKTIVAVSYVIDCEGGTSYRLYPTGNHPFWVFDEGWRRADLLDSGARLLLADGKTASVLSCLPVYRTNEESVGWFAKNEFNDQVGFECNFGDCPSIVRTAVSRDDEIYFSDDPQFRLTVYNFEVEDNHTYYVGSAGVWVHNDDCSVVAAAIAAPDSSNAAAAAELVEAIDGRNRGG
jgi:hypothetical protein